jgi:hypothetical protein
MSDNDIFDGLPQEAEKKGKQKRQITPERKAVILAQLKRGRETALKNRQNKALVERKKKGEGPAPKIEQNETISKQNAKLNKLESEIEELKRRIDSHKPNLDLKIEKLEAKKEELEKRIPSFHEKIMEKVIENEKNHQVIPPSSVEKPIEKVAPRVEPIREPEPVKIIEPEKPYVARSYNLRETMSLANARTDVVEDMSLFKPSLW